MFELKGNYYNGEFRPVPQKSCIKTITRACPSNISLNLWSLDVSYEQVEETIASASNGFGFWKKVSIEERVNYLRKFQSALKDKQEVIAQSIALEVGKPLWEAKTEAAALISKVDVTINESLPRIENKTINNIMPNTSGHVYHRPIGPCFIIGPFNFPCHLANTQILSALLAGNSIIFKPSEKTAYSGQLLIECFHEAGFPKGVINLIQGDGETARRIVKSKPIKGIFFTGSKEVGLKILGDTHKDLSKLVALELGGKNPTIAHEDANKELLIEELIKAAYLTTGQRCTATGTVLIHESILEEVITKFHQVAKGIIVDHPIEHEIEPFMGPLIDQGSLDNYLLYMGMAKREGIEEIMRGKHLSDKHFSGHYVSPSIHLAKKWNPKSHFLQSEIFGPNCVFIPYKNINDAIEVANATEYGLAASVFTQSENVFNDCLENIDSGLINLNRSTCGASARLPFGGIKNSGNYRPAAISMIDSCVYQTSSLQIHDVKAAGIDSIKGIKPASY